MWRWAFVGRVVEVLARLFPRYGGVDGRLGKDMHNRVYRARSVGAPMGMLRF